MCIHDVLFSGRDYTDAVASILSCVSPSNALRTLAKNPKLGTHAAIRRGTTTDVIGTPSGGNYTFGNGGFSPTNPQWGVFRTNALTSRTEVFIFATPKTTLLAVVD